MKFPLLSLATLLVIPSLVDASRIAVAWDMVNSGSSNLNSFINNAPNLFNWHSQDAFGKLQRSTDAIPDCLLDESNNPNVVSDTLGIIPFGDDETFFGVADTENSNTNGPVTAVWEFDILGRTDLEVTIDAAAMGDFESDDFFRWTASIDGGLEQEIIYGMGDTAAQRLYTLADGSTQIILSDPIKVEPFYFLSNEFQTLSGLVTGQGNTLTVTLEAEDKGSSEAFAFRNLIVKASDGTPTPAPTPQTCPEQYCSEDVITTLPTGACDPTGLVAVPLLQHNHTNGDVLVVLLGPQDPADAANLVITSPHGGQFKPDYIADRDPEAPYPYCPQDENCKVSADTNTLEIALLLQEKVIANYCKVPYVIASYLHRSKLDPNREVNEAAHGNVTAQLAW